MQRMQTLTLLAAAFATASLASGAAGAEVYKTRYWYANATSYCQTALPVFDGEIRKRPLAVQNEGRVPAFVTCSFAAQSVALDLVVLWGFNDADATISLTCTGVTGAAFWPNQFLAKTVTIQPGARVGMSWSPSDFGSSTTIPGPGHFSVSCALAPGVGINDSYVVFKEGVGD